MTSTPVFTRSFQSLIPFGIAFADQEHDRRRVRAAVVAAAAFCQSAGIKLGQLGDLVDVVRQGERDDVGLQAVDHRAGLRAGAAVRLLDRHLLPVFFAANAWRTPC